MDSTGFVLAAASGRVLDINQAVSDGFPVDSIDDVGDTALMASVGEGQIECVKALLEHGADIQIQHPLSDSTALMRAAECGRWACIKILLDFETQRMSQENLAGGSKDVKPVLNNVPGRSSSPKTVRRSSSGEVLLNNEPEPSSIKELVFFTNDGELLLNDNAAKIPVPSLLNKTDNNGNTALMIAAAKGDERCVRALLRDGARLCAADANGDNALLLALKNGHAHCARLLQRAMRKTVSRRCNFEKCKYY